MDISEAAAALVKAGRRLGARGLISAGEGNLSLRLDADQLLVSPTGVRKDELEPDDLVVVWLDHPEREAISKTGRRPSSDMALHLTMHRARPSISAIAHAHLPSVLALTLAGERPDPADLPETNHFIPRLPYIPFAAMGSQGLADMIAAALTEAPEPFANVAVLERHGAVAVGPDFPSAIDRLEIVEVLCRATAQALLLRAARATLERPAIV